MISEVEEGTGERGEEGGGSGNPYFTTLLRLRQERSNI